MFASYYFQTIGLQFTTPANAAFITGLNIVFIPIFGSLLFNIKIIRLELFAISLSFVGTVLLTVNFDQLGVNTGDLIILGTPVSIAFHILFTEKYVHHDMIELLWVQFTTMTICATIFVIFSDLPELMWYRSTLVLFTLFITVIFATVFAFGAQFYAQQQNITPTIIGIIFTLEPVFALILDFIVGDFPTITKMIGMTLIFTSFLIVSLVSTSKIQKRILED